MNIHTVAANLRNTIAGKEKMLESSRKKLVQRPVLSDDAWFATKATIQFLEINLDELRKILSDVEVCCEQATEASWALNPERMGR